MRHLTHLTAVAALVAGLGPQAQADEIGPEIYEKCVRSCVHFVTSPKDRDFAGSGSLIDVDQRLVLTANSLVRDNDSVLAQFPVKRKDGALETEKQKYIDRVKAGDAIKGKVLIRDKGRDLAMIQLESVPPDTPALLLATDSVQAGESIMSLGSLRKVDSVFNTLSHRVRSIEVEDLTVSVGADTLRTKCRVVTASIGTGGPEPNGGPLVDKRGRLVAVYANWWLVGTAGTRNKHIDCSEIRDFLRENKVTLKPGKEDK